MTQPRTLFDTIKHRVAPDGMACACDRPCLREVLCGGLDGQYGAADGVDLVVDRLSADRTASSDHGAFAGPTLVDHIR